MLAVAKSASNTATWWPNLRCRNGGNVTLQAASHSADASDASPVRLLVHSGRLVELAEEEVHLLLDLVGGRNYGGASKLWIW